VPLAPRRKYGATPIKRLNPIVSVRGVEYIAVVQELAAIPTRELGEVHGSLLAQRNELIAALDLLFTGT
jgi:toxin CcdB